METTITIGALEVEWRRIAVLTHCLSVSRRGESVDPETLEELKLLQQMVAQSRREAWQNVTDLPMSPLAYDILAMVVAPELEPYLGWTFQSLQIGTSSPYPTAALVQELLGLNGEQAKALHETLKPDSPLLAARLIEYSGDLYQPLKPAAGVSARLIGRKMRQPVPHGARRIEDRPQWSQLVLPEASLTLLREFLLWIKHRSIVVDQWGGYPSGGPIALFRGPSGTGKTFAAAVLAADLGWDLYRVDLSALISKYIGETEKNLNRLFEACEGRRIILQFDEADSLFGKRTDIKDARDRYANLEINYLLTRIESYQGPCILTTNMYRNMDEAFIRRFHTVLSFARPDEKARAALWRQLIPPKAPLAEQVDFNMMGKSVNLSGGNIRNAATLAALYAADRNEAIDYPHLALACWRELSKDGRKHEKRDLGPLNAFMPEGGILC